MARLTPADPLEPGPTGHWALAAEPFGPGRRGPASRTL